jgi:hypothetical protein
VTEVVRVAGGAGTRELWSRGGRLRRPGAGRLAGRLDRLRGGGATVRAAAGTPPSSAEGGASVRGAAGSPPSSTDGALA